MSVSLILPLAAAAANSSQGGGLGMLLQFAPLILIFAVMYLLLIRPQQKKQKEHEALLGRLKAGDRVLTSGGIYGTITGVTEKAFQLKVADGVVVEISRGAVATVIQEGAGEN
ncbi:MAG: preprotein translocase subunit YajC [Lentisphaeria bacterium]|jgi:preprotein translocase subunit YajC